MNLNGVNAWMRIRGKRHSDRGGVDDLHRDRDGDDPWERGSSGDGLGGGKD